MKKNILIIILLVIVISLATYIVKDYFSDNKSHVEKTIVDTFLYDFRNGYDYSSGAAQLYGYIDIEDRGDAVSGDMYKYVTFHILESNSEGFMNYLKSNVDNLYIKEDSIGLGCIINGKIKLVNYSDKYYSSGLVITIDDPFFDINKLLASTKKNPIVLNVAKYIDTTYNSYHPVCESKLSIFLTP